MCQSSISVSEYYREHFDPTLHPLLYKLVNHLTSQAGDFQKAVDPVYDRFLLESVFTTNETEKIENLPIKKIKVQQRHFAGLGIITCVNLDVLGFCNVGHVDNDYITVFAHEKCYRY